MKRISALMVLVAGLTAIDAFAQSGPDSVIIRFDQFYLSWGTGDDEWLLAVDCVDYFYSAKLIKDKNGYAIGNRVVPKAAVRRMTEAAKNSNSTSFSVADFGVDTSSIKSHATKIFEKNRRAKEGPWNQQQKDFMIRQLGDISNYERFFRYYLEAGCCYHLHANYRDQYTIKTYEAGKLTSDITSRRRRTGFYIPWVNSEGDTLVDYNIERDLNMIIPLKNHSVPLKGKKLLDHLAREIIRYNSANKKLPN